MEFELESIFIISLCGLMDIKKERDYMLYTLNEAGVYPSSLALVKNVSASLVLPRALRTMPG